MPKAEVTQSEPSSISDAARAGPCGVDGVGAHRHAGDRLAGIDDEMVVVGEAYRIQAHATWGRAFGVLADPAEFLTVGGILEPGGGGAPHQPEAEVRGAL